MLYAKNYDECIKNGDEYSQGGQNFDPRSQNFLFSPGISNFNCNLAIQK
jgi:hypothetical protein